MFKRLTVAASFVGLALCLLAPAQLAHASWNSNRIIDDAIFDDVNSMNASQIDAFLNSKPNSCISQNRGFSALDPTGYSPSQGYKYGGSVSAGTVIAHAAQAYDISPRVLLTTLQKEQSLVGGEAGCSTLRYTGAVGYGCPDSGTTHDYSGVNLYSINGNAVTSVSGTCVNTAEKAGFTQQVIRGAWLLKFGEQRALGNINWAIVRGNWDNSDDLDSCYSGPMTQGTYKTCPSSPAVYFDGYRTIDGVSTHMDTGATASLYWYTPHFHGNQNFVSIYENWFGTTIVPNLSWTNAGFQVFDKTESARVDPGQLQPGELYIAKLHAINTGNFTWSKTGLNPVLLGTTNPDNHTSNLCYSSWLTCSRTGSFNEDSVAPGAAGDFKFTFRAPYVPGSYREYFKPLAEMLAWAKDDGGDSLGIKVVSPGTFSWSNAGYKVLAADESTYVDPGNLQPGQTYLVKLHAINTGTATWKDTGNFPVNLGTSSSEGRSSILCTTGWSGCARPTTLEESSVAPGQMGHFLFKIKAPYQPGTYREYFKPLAEMMTWMNDSNEPLGIKVADLGSFSWKNGGYKVLTADESAFVDPGNLTAGQTYMAKLAAFNTGTATWNKTGTTPFTLGTANPAGRNSILCNGQWLSCNRPVYLQENSVPPGGIGNFKFTFTAPAAGTYREYFKPLAEFLSWTNDSSEPLGITTH
jgi:hypothetical protein